MDMTNITNRENYLCHILFISKNLLKPLAAGKLMQKKSQSSDILSYRESRLEEGEHSEQEMSSSPITSKSPLASFRAKEEEIERMKKQVKNKVSAQLGRKEEEAKRLAEIRQELEALADPTKKEVASMRKRIDAVDRELKLLGRTCLKKEKEYKEALEEFSEKNKCKAGLLNKLMELVGESERLRLERLEELSNTIDSLH